MSSSARRVFHSAMVAVALACVLGCAATQAASIKVSCAAVGQELEFCKRTAEAWARKTGNEVKIVTPPNDASERLALYQQLLGAGSDKIDVLQIDVIWPALLGKHLLDLKSYAHGAEKDHFAGFIANNTDNGRLVAMPWFANAGLLFFRKDLLHKYGQKVPVTWDELTASAAKIQKAERAAGNVKMWGYVWQGRAYEGLTCNALEWVLSYGGGSIVESDGKVSIKNPNAIKALQMAAAWVGTVSPAAVLDYTEEESRGVFQAGNAVYMRNWPYAWSLSQDDDSMIRGKVGVALLPKGSSNGRHAAVRGGESLAVSKYSRHPAEAADLVMHMTSAAMQSDRALRGSFDPTIGAVSKDPQIVKANPFMGGRYGSFTSAVSRPTTVTGAHYNQVSKEFWSATHDVLSGKSRADEAVDRLNESLTRLGKDGRWN